MAISKLLNECSSLSTIESNKSSLKISKFLPTEEKVKFGSKWLMWLPRLKMQLIFYLKHLPLCEERKWKKRLSFSLSYVIHLPLPFSYCTTQDMEYKDKKLITYKKKKFYSDKSWSQTECVWNLNWPLRTEIKSYLISVHFDVLICKRWLL